IWATDHSWLAAFRQAPCLARAVTVDVTPPLLEVMPGEHVAHLGGSECAVYRVGPDAVRSGVQVGDEFFPGVAGYFADAGLRVALFALPQNLPDARPAVTAVDLASLRGSPVPAANAGRVVFAGALGIYGNTVVLDHGLGVFSLYGHLSEVGVKPGAAVGRGDPIGKTGDTGLAAGDHLHFSIMIHGVHVDPVEWWDAHWMHDHVEARLAEYPRAARPRAARARWHPAHPRGARGGGLPLPLRRPRRPPHLDRPSAPERGHLPRRRAGERARGPARPERRRGEPQADPRRAAEAR